MKKPFALTLLAVAAVSTLQARAAASGEQVVRSLEREIRKTIEMNYLLFLPEAYEPAGEKEWPLLLFLHGAGERGDDIARVTVHGPPRIARDNPDFPFIVASPQCPTGEVWDADAVLALLDHLVETHRIDRRRVFLTGLSMGGFGTWDIGVAAPERFAALVPICGGGRPINVFLAGGQRKERLQEIPIWAFHGGDDQVVNPEQSKEMAHAFESIGNEKTKLTIYEQAGHDSWTETYNDPALYEWLAKQRLED